MVYFNKATKTYSKWAYGNNPLVYMGIKCVFDITYIDTAIFVFKC